MLEKTLITDVDEAVNLIETYNLTALVWSFEECPLEEIKHYVSRGREELVVVAHKEAKYISFRLIPYIDNYEVDIEAYRIMLDFHPNYYIYIILNPEADESE